MIYLGKLCIGRHSGGGQNPASEKGLILLGLDTLRACAGMTFDARPVQSFLSCGDTMTLYMFKQALLILRHQTVDNELLESLLATANAHLQPLRPIS